MEIKRLVYRNLLLKIVKITKKQPLILDASVVVKWFSVDNEQDYDKALFILELIKNGEIWLIIPDLLLYELSNALLKGKNFDIESLNVAVKTILALEVEIFNAQLPLLEKANEIAATYSLTVYDALYAALAVIKQCQLITANPKCFNKLRGEYVVNLADVEF